MDGSDTREREHQTEIRSWFPISVRSALFGAGAVYPFADPLSTATNGRQRTGFDDLGCSYAACVANSADKRTTTKTRRRTWFLSPLHPVKGVARPTPIDRPARRAKSTGTSLRNIVEIDLAPCPIMALAERQERRRLRFASGLILCGIIASGRRDGSRSDRYTLPRSCAFGVCHD